MVALARAETDTIRAHSNSRIHYTERAVEAKVAEKTANLTLEAEQAVRLRADRLEREEQEHMARFRVELAEEELRKRTLLADEEAAAARKQHRLREEVVELETQKHAQFEREERSRVHAEIRERSRDSEAGRAYATMLEKMQLQMADFQRQAIQERDRMAREMQERDVLYLADSQRKQKAIDQLTEALSATLSRLPTASPAVASGSAPPSPSGWRRRPRHGKGRIHGTAKEGGDSACGQLPRDIQPPNQNRATGSASWRWRWFR